MGLCLLLQACGGDGGPQAEEVPAEPVSCSVADQRDNLRAFLGQKYYWYSQLKAPDDGASNLDAYFHSMLYTPPDRYSFTQPTASFNQVFTNGWRLGYGYTLVWADDGHTALRVRTVEGGSPVARAGLRRGDAVLSIDGFTPAQIWAGQIPTVTTAGVERTFLLRAASGDAA